MTLLRWLTFLLGSKTVILTVLLSWIYLFLQMLALFYNGFPSAGKFLSCCCLSFYWLSIKFTTGCPVSSHSIWLSRADWDGLCDHLRDVPWEAIFKPGASADASEFYEWVQVGIGVYIPHRKHQVKSHSSPWFSASCSASIVDRSHLFVFIKRINLLILK